jgi:hypothetical protein
VLEFARAEAGKKARGLAHPQLCLDAIQEGVQHGGLAGLRKVLWALGVGGGVCWCRAHFVLPAVVARIVYSH